MNIFSLLASAFLFLGLASPALSWDIAKQIRETNVIVGADGAGFCSGTIISSKYRLILTAEHCVRDSIKREEKEFVNPDTGEITKKTIEKRMPMEIWQNVTKDYETVSRKLYVAKIVGRDPTHDVALLQVVDGDFVAAGEAKLSKAGIAVGQDIWIIGNPGIDFDNSITRGIVSAAERTLAFPEGKLKVFQTDAVAIGGNSGGSVVNGDGELVGTLSAGLRSGGITFAVPISETVAMIKGTIFRDILQ